MFLLESLRRKVESSINLDLKRYMGLWAGLIWLKMGNSGGLLWTLILSGFRKKLGERFASKVLYYSLFTSM
jgi:hypothetical protein